MSGNLLPYDVVAYLVGEVVDRLPDAAERRSLLTTVASVCRLWREAVGDVCRVRLAAMDALDAADWDIAALRRQHVPRVRRVPHQFLIAPWVLLGGNGGGGSRCHYCLQPTRHVVKLGPGAHQRWRVCQDCRSDLPCYRTITRTRAHDEYRLTDDALRQLPHMVCKNPRYYGSQMRLYLLADVREAAENEENVRHRRRLQRRPAAA